MSEVSTAVSSAVSTTETKWFSGFDAETQNYINTRGLADKDPAAAFLEAAKGHREAQAYIGVPKEQLLRLPKADAAPEEWDEVYKRLGYSTNADDYKLEALKRADGSDVDDGFKDFIRAQATDLKLSPDAAARFASAILARQEADTAAQTATSTEAATRALEALKQSWGANFEANKVIADNAYAAMMQAAGFTQEQMSGAIQKLGETAGRAETMQMLLAVGQKMGEDRFVSSGGASGGQMRYTTDTAKARIAELKADSQFIGRYLAGGAAEAKEMNDLHQIAYGTSA